MTRNDAIRTLRTTSNIGIGFIITNAGINIGHGRWWWAAGDIALTIILCANRTAISSALDPTPTRFEYNPDGTRKDTT
jgi:hypothetical protein